MKKLKLNHILRFLNLNKASILSNQLDILMVKSLSIECPYAAPPYIDRVWRSLIAYDQKYKEIWYKICQGYMRRIEPRNNYWDQFDKYKQCREELIKRKDKLHPFNAIWPE